MNLFLLFKFLINHPLNRKQTGKAIKRFLKWQLGSSILKSPVVYPFIEDSVLIVEKGMTGATGNIYNGLHEYQEMLFLLHFLRENDLFIDVGANVGTYTVLASSNCKARAIAFEPVHKTFERLKRNILINDLADRVELVNKAAGGSIKELIFTDSLDAMNHAIPEESIDKSPKQITVRCTTLNEHIKEDADLIKIDVEGFETEVIGGASKILSSKRLKAIIIELNGSGLRYGFSEESIHAKLLLFGFLPYTYNPCNRELIALESWGNHNTVYVRDINFVRERISKSRKFWVNGRAL